VSLSHSLEGIYLVIKGNANLIYLLRYVCLSTRLKIWVMFDYFLYWKSLCVITFSEIRSCIVLSFLMVEFCNLDLDNFHCFFFLNVRYWSLFYSQYFSSLLPLHFHLGTFWWVGYQKNLLKRFWFVSNFCERKGW